MPDLRLKKTRATLPEGYQFGDAARAAQHTREWFNDVVLAINQGWRPWHENNAERLARQQRSPYWNTIEPD